MTGRLEGAEQQPTLPSTDVVLSELKILRQRAGISHERVRRYATTIQTLPCVIDERVKRRFSEGDEHVAAYNVIGCAIEHLVRDPRKRVILRHTLNYEGDRFDLDSRRQAAADELIMSTSACEPIEARAYVDLAALLVDATSTPCPRRELIVTDQDVFEAFQNFRNLFDMSQLLSFYARERDPAQREASARILMDRLPRGQVYVENQLELGGQTDAERLRFLLEDALDVHYANLREYGSRRWRGLQLLHPNLFKVMFDQQYPSNASPDGVSSGRPSRYAGIAAESERLSSHRVRNRRVWNEERRSVTPAFYAYRKVSIRWLAWAMRDAERRNAWGSTGVHEYH